jgi:hypothetical protein
MLVLQAGILWRFLGALTAAAAAHLAAALAALVRRLVLQALNPPQLASR